MVEHFFFDWPLWAIVPILFAAMMGANQYGYRLGHRDQDGYSEPAKTQVGTIEAALLGLLGLLLGFTYSMASSRYEARKALVGAEVNAIRTAYNRSLLLEPELSRPVNALLRRYLDARIDAGRSAGPSQDDDLASRRVQREVWELVGKRAPESRNPEMTTLFIEALATMADTKTERNSALADHVPVSVLVLVFLATPIVFGMVGYGFGLAGKRGMAATTVLAVLIGLVVAVVLDLDRPRKGLIRVSQQGLVRFRDQLDETGL